MILSVKCYSNGTTKWNSTLIRQSTVMFQVGCGFHYNHILKKIKGGEWMDDIIAVDTNLIHNVRPFEWLRSIHIDSPDESHNKRAWSPSRLLY